MINLLPPKQRLNIELSKRNSSLRRYLELGCLATLVLAVIIYGSFYYLKRQEQNTLKTIELNKEKLTELEKVQVKAEELSTTIKTIAALVASDAKFSTMLTDIGKLMPQGSVLTGIEIADDTTDAPLVISAQVEDQKKAAVLRNNLVASDLFEVANIKTIIHVDKNTEGVADDSEGGDTPTNQEIEESALDKRYKYITVIDAYFKAPKEKRQ